MSAHLSPETLTGHGGHTNMLWMMTSMAILFCCWGNSFPKAGFTVFLLQGEALVML